MKTITQYLNWPFLSLPLLLVGMPFAANAEVEEEFNATYPLNKDGKVWIENVNGSLTITAWDKEQVQVAAVKKADNKDILGKIEIKIESSEDSFKLETQLPKVKKWLFGGSSQKGQVSYEIMVPAGVEIKKAGSVNGGVSIEGIGGPVHASTVNGALSVKALKDSVDLSAVNGSLKAGFQALPSKGSVKMSTVNGSLELRLPEELNARFSAHTVNGGVESDFDLPVKKNFPVGTNLDAQIGEGGPSIDLSTVNGRISIRKN